MAAPPTTPPVRFIDIAGAEAVHNYHELFNRRPLLLERGLASSKLSDVSRYRIEWGGWEDLVAYPRGSINETVVREFYAMLSVEPVERSTNVIMVRGVEVPFHWIDINTALGLSSTTVAPQQHYEIKWNLSNISRLMLHLPAATASVFPNMSGPRANYTVAGLSSEMREWKRFINNRILPTEDFEVLTDDELLLLYAIKREVYINWGRLIHRAAWEYARPSCTLPFLPFGSLISHLCTHVNRVPTFSLDEWFPSPVVRRGLVPRDVPGDVFSSDESDGGSA